MDMPSVNYEVELDDSYAEKLLREGGVDAWQTLSPNVVFKNPFDARVFAESCKAQMTSVPGVNTDTSLSSSCRGRVRLNRAINNMQAEHKSGLCSFEINGE